MGREEMKMTEMKWTGLKFEPHGLYGQKIDGEAMPFGYISQQGYGKPIFELSPIFVHPTEDLRALALQMAAAPEMAEALRAEEEADELLDAADEYTHRADAEGWLNDPTGSLHVTEAWDRARQARDRAKKMRRAVLQKAGG
jgi:hypothetical protein